MIGRVLRQPAAACTNVEALDQAHVFCADVTVQEAVQKIKKGLEMEGMGDISGEIKVRDGESKRNEIEVPIRRQFRSKHIMVPRVLHRDASRKYRNLDYEADLLARVNFEQLAWGEADSFEFASYDVGMQQTFAVDFAGKKNFDVAAIGATAVAVDQPLDRPGLIRRMLDVVPNPWQGARILDEALASLRNHVTEHEILAARLTLLERIKRDVQKQIETAAEGILRDKVKNGDIVFKLLAAPLDDLNFEFQELLRFHVASSDDTVPLLRTIGTPLERSLYETAFKRDVNAFEKDVALYLDENDAVTWWWRIAARRDWGLQGWMKNRVYPDFLIHLDAERDTARLLVLETKGKHLQGSEDTEFKTKFFALLERAYAVGREAGEVDLFADSPNEMRFRILIQDQAWQSDLESALS
jgi:type III restriction enzyme